MGDLLTTFDLVIFFGFLIAAMTVGFVAGRKEETSEDYFLAGKSIPWWGVAGSIFGSNVSANHLVGMVGIGFSFGFAQSHFELGAIAGLMLLCYGFLPVYRKLNVYTLSEYLGRRYDDRSRLCYAVIMVIIMAVVQMVPALYIGARFACLLLGGEAVEAVEVEPATGAVGSAGSTTSLDVNTTYYAIFVVALAMISASYTILGGLKAVVWTDVIQSALLLVAGLGVAFLTFGEIGGWGEMMRLDRAAPDDEQLMHLYLPSDHPKLPWTGVLSGLMMLHFFYWGTNQFIVQRALGARSDREARLGIISAGFLKLLIPFFSIGTGVAAAYHLAGEFPDRSIAPDTVFAELVRLLVPLGYGLIGLIAAGIIGAILSSIDSMMNSAATIVTFDVYRRYINPQATDRQMIRVGRVSIAAFVVLATLLCLFVIDPNSKENFFLQIVDYQGYLTPGLLVVFLLGMFWSRGTPTAGFVTIVAGVLFSGLVELVYDRSLVTIPAVRAQFGESLNFFHRVVAVVALCTATYVAISLRGTVDPERCRLTWTRLGGHSANALRKLCARIGASLALFGLLAVAMYSGWLSPVPCAIAGSLWTLAMFLQAIVRSPHRARDNGSKRIGPLRLFAADDRLWAGLLCSVAVWMMYYYY